MHGAGTSAPPHGSGRPRSKWRCLVTKLVLRMPALAGTALAVASRGGWLPRAHPHLTSEFLPGPVVWAGTPSVHDSEPTRRQR